MHASALVSLALGMSKRPREAEEEVLVVDDQDDDDEVLVVDDQDDDDEVLIVGTGLTFADVVVTLVSRGHQGQLIGMSKTGLTPRRHAPSRPVELGDLPAGDVFRWVSRGARHAGENWRGFIDAVRPHTIALWQRLSWAERERFLRRLAGFWDVHRHRMPPSVADRIQALVVEGRLHIERGWLPSVKDNGRFSVAFQGGEREFDWIVTCTGPDTDWRRVKESLVEAVVEHGWASYDPLGMGLMVDGDGRVGESGRLWAIGTLCRGCRWETTAIPELRVQAQRLAECLGG